MRTIINNSLFCLLAMVAATLCGCSDSIFDDEAQNDGGSIRLAADIEQLAVMRVNDCGFCDGDMMGVYVVDYEGGNPGTLKLKGNRGGQQVDRCLRVVLEGRPHAGRCVRILPVCCARKHRGLPV